MSKDFIKGYVVPIVCSFISGFGVYLFNSDWETKAREQEWIPKGEWMHEVKEKGWIEKNSCPAYPLKMVLVGPGKNSSVRIEKNKFSEPPNGELQKDIVIKLSRAIEDEKYHIGVVYKFDDSEEFRVIFTHKYRPSQFSGRNSYKMNESGDVLRLSQLFIPEVNQPKNLSIRVFVSESKLGVSSTFTSLDQLLDLPYILSYTDELSLRPVIKS